MNALGLLQLLKSLSLSEWEEFERFLSQSPSQINKKAFKLLQYLKAFSPDFELSKEEWQAGFAIIWPGKAFDAAEFRNKQFLLKAYLMEFLAWKELKENKDEESLLYLRQLRKRGLQDLFDKESKKVLRRWDKTNGKTEEEFYFRYRLSDESNMIFGQSQVRKTDESLLAKLKYLDQYYLRVRLRETCELLNRQQLLNELPRDDFFEKWLNQQANDIEAIEDSAIRVYLQIYRCYKLKDQDAEFAKLIHLIKELYPIFPLSEARAIFRHAQNHSIRQINLGNQDYLVELFQLFDFQLKNGIIFQEGMLDHSDYKNVVVVALRLDKYEWAENFILKYKGYIQPNYRDNVYQFCQASLLDARGKQDEAIRFLGRVSFSDIFYEISSRILLIKLYLEKEDWEGLFYANDSFERFLKRSKVIGRERKNAHLGFTWAIRLLSKLKEKRGSYSPREYLERTEGLRQKIKRKGQITQLKWILDQLIAP